MNQCLMHYTSLDVAIKIVESGSFKFSSPKNSNDLQEAQLHLIHNEYDKIKYACFTMSNKEIIPMWKIYACKEYDNNFEGVIFKMILKNDVDLKKLFKNKDIKSKKIKYLKVNEYNKKCKFNNLKDFDIQFVKSNYWKYENEYRYISDKEYELINFDAIKKIIIILNPIYKNADIRSIKKNKLKSLRQIDIKTYNKISFSRSSLCNVIDTTKIRMR